MPPPVKFTTISTISGTRTDVVFTPHHKNLRLVHIDTTGVDAKSFVEASDCFITRFYVGPLQALSVVTYDRGAAAGIYRVLLTEEKVIVAPDGQITITPEYLSHSALWSLYMRMVKDYPPGGMIMQADL